MLQTFSKYAGIIQAILGAAGTASCLGAVSWLFATNSHPGALVWLFVAYIAFFALSQGAVHIPMLAQAENAKRPSIRFRIEGRFKEKPAMTYSPTRFPGQYHRRWRA